MNQAHRGMICGKTWTHPHGEGFWLEFQQDGTGEVGPDIDVITLQAALPDLHEIRCMLLARWAWEGCSYRPCSGSSSQCLDQNRESLEMSASGTSSTPTF